MNLWPPFLGAGIKVKSISDDFTDVVVQMKLRKWNGNYVGTAFGGSLFSMTDPFYALMTIKNLGKDYIVWDKESSIRFKKPGKGMLTAHFNISKEKIEEIRKDADTHFKAEPKLTVLIKDEAGDVVAEVDKVLYIRRKDNKPSP